MHTHRIRVAARAAAATAILAAVTLAATSPSGGEPVTTPQAAVATVTPAGGLVDNQFVTVDGTGFPTGEFVGHHPVPDRLRGLRALPLGHHPDTGRRPAP